MYIFLLEDNIKLRKDLAYILECNHFTVFQYTDAQDFFENFQTLVPAVIVTDMRMPGLSGGELQTKLANHGINIPMIFISGESTNCQIVSAMKNGAVDFLLKPFSREQFLGAVGQGIEISILETKKLVKKAVFDKKIKNLSPRELQTFHLLVLGFNNTEIVTKLGISLPTAKQYKKMVFYKLNLNTMSELIEFNLSS